MPSNAGNRISNHRRRRRALIGTVSLVLATALGLSATGGSNVGSTDAAWRSDDSATGTFTAAPVPAPSLTAECRYRPGLLGIGARVEIYWSTPEGYNLDDAELLASTSGLGSVLEPLTGFNLEGNTEGSPDAYTTTVFTNLLDGLLGLGSQLEISIMMSRPDYDWTSDAASIATNAGLVGGIGGSCENLDESTAPQ